MRGWLEARRSPPEAREVQPNHAISLFGPASVVASEFGRPDVGAQCSRARGGRGPGFDCDARADRCGIGRGARDPALSETRARAGVFHQPRERSDRRVAGRGALRAARHGRCAGRGGSAAGEVNYYNKKVNNALINVPIPRTVGDADGVIITNVASIQNKGIEVLLNWKDEINTNLSYTISGNVTFNDNNVLALNGGQAIFGGGIGAAQGFTTITDNGHPIGSFYVLKTLGIFNSVGEVSAYTDSDGKIIQPNSKAGDFRYFDKNGDGQIDDNDRVFAGSYQPVAYFGLNLGVNFKSWDFSLSIYGNVGNEVYNGKKAVKVEGKDNVEKNVVYDRWTSSNKNQSEPGAHVGNLPASDYFVESGSFLRINNLTVGYTFPAPLLEKLKISSLRVYATSQNLFTLMKYSGFTAELPGDPINSGIELSAYPTTRTIAAGLNISF